MARKKPPRIATTPTPLTGLVAFRLIHLADTISRAATLVFEKQFGLNNSELRAMIALRDMQPLTIAQLSRAGRIDKAWVSRSVASLLDRGLVSREAHPTDQRMALIRLTATGLDLHAHFRAGRSRAAEAAAGGAVATRRISRHRLAPKECRSIAERAVDWIAAGAASGARPARTAADRS